MDETNRKSLTGLAALVFAIITGLLITVSPALASAVVALPVTIALMYKRPQWALMLLLALTFEVIPGAFQPQFPLGGAIVSLAELLAPVALVLALAAQPSNSRGLVAQMNGMVAPVVFLLTCYLVSFLYVKGYAPNKNFFSEARGLVNWCILPLMVLVTGTRSQLARCQRGLFVIATVIAVYVIVQSLFDVRIMTLARVEALDNRANSDITRSIAGGGIYLIIYCLYIAATNWSSGIWTGARATPYVLLFVLALAFQFGRGVWVASFVGLLVASFLQRGIGQTVKTAILSVLCLVVAVSALSVVRPRLVEAIVERATGIADEMRSGGSFNWRMQENALAIRAIQASPLFGVGVGGEYKLVNSTQGHFLNEERYIHNAYLYFPLKMGAFASLIPVLFLFSIFKLGRAGFRQCDDLELRGMLASAVGTVSVIYIICFTQPEWTSYQGIYAISIMFALVLAIRNVGKTIARHEASK